MLVYTNSDCQLKDNGFNHPERKEKNRNCKSIKQIKNFKINFKNAIADMKIISLVHPRKHVEKIFNNIPKNGLIGVEKEPYADTMLSQQQKCYSGIKGVAGCSR